MWKVQDYVDLVDATVLVAQKRQLKYLPAMFSADDDLVKEIHDQWMFTSRSCDDIADMLKQLRFESMVCMGNICVLLKKC
jgi:hypothetical protein